MINCWKTIDLIISNKTENHFKITVYKYMFKLLDIYNNNNIIFLCLNYCYYYYYYLKLQLLFIKFESKWTCISHILQCLATNCCLGKCCGGTFGKENIFKRAPEGLSVPLHHMLPFQLNSGQRKMQVKLRYCWWLWVKVILDIAIIAAVSDNPAFNIIGKHFTKLFKSYYVLTHIC